MVGNTTAKLAVLIDADNAQYARIELLLAEVAKYGTAHVKRAYGDWTGPFLVNWKDQLLKHSIQPIQQFAYTQGKNSTDSAMIIDAMDLLYTGRFDGFCIVSSDSDFTRLASRIRESGLVVYGFGERKTPKPFVAACDKFVYVEILGVGNPALTEERGSPGNEVGVPRDRAPAGELQYDTRLPERELRLAVQAMSDEDGWANLANIGLYMTKQYPAFDARFYGYEKLKDLISATAAFDMDRRIPGPGKLPVMYAREKRLAHMSHAT